jgi:Zn-dependent peptidase ImmA (M78 family)
MVPEKLPPEPLIFTLGHEFKHHLVDSDMGTVYCDISNQRKEIEIGAEVFAAELIFPDLDFTAWMGRLGVPSLGGNPQHLVKLKRESQTTLSYAGIRKKANFLKFIPDGAFLDVKWKMLEVKIYGVPLYQQLLQHKRVAAASL